MAYLENGAVALWPIKNPKQIGLVELNAEDKEDAAFLDAYLDGSYIVVSYGNPFNPTFERVVNIDLILNIVDENGNLRSHLVLTRFIKEKATISNKVSNFEQSICSPTVTDIIEIKTDRFFKCTRFGFDVSGGGTSRTTRKTGRNYSRGPSKSFNGGSSCSRKRCNSSIFTTNAFSGTQFTRCRTFGKIFSYS